MLKRVKSSRKSRPESIEETVATYVSAARDAAFQWGQYVFDHSRASIDHLETILDEIHAQMPQKSFRKRIGLGPSETDVEQWANLWGIYLGETLRIALGGTWITGHEEAPSLLAVSFDDGQTIAFPTARVYRRITEGNAENVAAYYDDVAASVGGA
jgi:hypothetical protein